MQWIWEKSYYFTWLHEDFLEKHLQQRHLLSKLEVWNIQRNSFLSCLLRGCVHIRFAFALRGRGTNLFTSSHNRTKGWGQKMPRSRECTMYTATYVERCLAHHTPTRLPRQTPKFLRRSGRGNKSFYDELTFASCLVEKVFLSLEYPTTVLYSSSVHSTSKMLYLVLFKIFFVLSIFLYFNQNYV